MIGVDFGTAEVADAVEIASFQRGLLVLRAGDSAVRVAPPLVITREQAATGLRLFTQACADVAERGPEAFPATGHTAGPEVPEGA
jgi:4-aminobutyrate aminotransferase